MLLRKFFSQYLCIGWVAATIVLVAVGCSVKKNNATTRFYHNLTTRYNVYYNGSKHFEEAYQQFIDGVQESYTEPIAFDPIVYMLRDRSQAGGVSGVGPFDKALNKADKAIREHSLRTKPPKRPGWHKDPKQRQEQQRTEYNSVLYKAWLLRGVAQLYNGELQEALATFDYMARLYATEEMVRVPALLWQIRCLSLSGRPAEANELFARIDSAWHSAPLYMGARVEYHLALGEDQQAIYWLQRYAPRATLQKQRMRLFYLLGQLEQRSGNKAAAYAAYSKVLSYSPPPALEFASRLRRTELSPRSATSVRRMLLNMSERSKYRPQLDQIYYALGKSYLGEADTLEALKAFTLSADSSQIRGLDYALAHIAQGEIYMHQKRYLSAADAYQAALGALPQSDSRYARVQYLAEGLTAMRPDAIVVHEGDSLLHLARSSEVYRIRVIDSIIHRLRVEEAERLHQRQRDSIAEVNRALGTGLPGLVGSYGMKNATESQEPVRRQTNNKFYFYNLELLRQGTREFERQWGNRRLVDLWRLSQHSGLGNNIDNSAVSTDTTNTSIRMVFQTERTELSDSIAPVDNPLRREYYLSRLPLTENSQSSLEENIEGSMLRLAEMLAMRLDLLEDAALMYSALQTRYPSGSFAEEALYQQYILSLRMDRLDRAEAYRRQYLVEYPQTKRAHQMRGDNYLAHLLAEARKVEEIYKKAYSAYWAGAIDTLGASYRELAQLYPESDYLPRVRFLWAMGSASAGDTATFRRELVALAKGAGPEEIVHLSQSILSGIEEGRPVFAGRPTAIDWGRIAPSITEAGVQPYSPWESGATLSYILLSDPSVPPETLLYQLAIYHYTNYTQQTIPVRSIDLSDRGTMLVVGRFSSHSAATAYALGWRSYADSVQFGATLLVPVSLENVNRIKSRNDLVRYLDESPRLGLEQLISLQLLSEARAMLSREPIPAAEIMVDTSAADVETTDPKDADYIPNSLVQDRLLAQPQLSYDEVLQRQRTANKQRKELLNAKQRERKEGLKQREQLRRERLRERAAKQKQRK